MTTLDIEKFDPTTAELNAVVEKSKGIIAIDLLDDEITKTHLKVVKTARIELRDVRIRVEKAGKALREDATAFNRAVLAKEKELLAIVVPEEKRLASIEAEAEEAILMERRKELLPERLARLESIGDSVTVEVDLLRMDTPTFDAYFNERVAEKNRLEKEQAEKEQAEREATARAEQEKKDAELREREEKVKEAERKIEEEARAKEREEKARQEERERIERAEKERIDREAREKAEAEEEVARAKAKLEADEKYNHWLMTNGYNAEIDVLKTEGAKVVLYRRVSEFEK